MSQEFHAYIPTIPQVPNLFATRQLAFEFRREVEYRQEFQDYCQWYAQTAMQHQQDLQKMRGESNLFRWFLGGLGR